MKAVLKRMAIWALPRLPISLTMQLIRTRPTLINLMPEHFDMTWPYFMNDVKVHINTSNMIERAIIYGYGDTGQKIKCLVKPGYYCVDIGANIGAVTLMMAKLSGEKGRVLAFEPGPPYFEQLNSNLAANPDLKAIVTTVNKGLSDAPGDLFWRPDPEHPFNAGLSTTEGTSITVDTVDAYFKQNSWPRLDLLKIDVESMEWEVIQGSRETIAKFHPTIIYETLELFREARGFDIFLEIENMLKPLGYEFYGINEKNEFYIVDSKNLPQDTVAVHTTRRAEIVGGNLRRA